jgi:hypothetical protein
VAGAGADAGFGCEHDAAAINSSGRAVKRKLERIK